MLSGVSGGMLESLQRASGKSSHLALAPEAATKSNLGPTLQGREAKILVSDLHYPRCEGVRRVRP